MEPPIDVKLPLFVYGALKPGMPAFFMLEALVHHAAQDAVSGQLWVRDGLPLLIQSDDSREMVEGWRLRFKDGLETNAYDAVCSFEPRKHYQWIEVTLQSAQRANALVARYPKKGNPHYLGASNWCLSDDPAFGAGLAEVGLVLAEVDRMEGESFDQLSRKFFRSQMAYLLLWSVLERLSAFCFGPGTDPVRRVKQLHKLPGMEELVRSNVRRTDKVSDSRNPDCTCKLDGSNPQKCFDYYYQVRSNLSHRGKGLITEFAIVHDSLRELLEITTQYLEMLASKSEDRMT